MRKTIITLAAVAGIIAGTAGAANASVRPTWEVWVTSNVTHKVLKVDWPIYSLAAAQTDKAREQIIFNRYCNAGALRFCATAHIRQVTW